MRATHYVAAARTLEFPCYTRELNKCLEEGGRWPQRHSNIKRVTCLDCLVALRDLVNERIREVQ